MGVGADGGGGRGGGGGCLGGWEVGGGGVGAEGEGKGEGNKGKGVGWGRGGCLGTREEERSEAAAWEGGGEDALVMLDGVGEDRWRRLGVLGVV